MSKSKLILLCIVVEMMLIICVTLANVNPTPVIYFVFYNLAYGMVFSFLVPLYCLGKEKGTLSSVGIKKLGVRQFAVLNVFVAFSIGGQLIPMILAGEQIPWHLLPMGIVPLIMTTFFEEFLFRGFIQGRIEQHFGWLPAIIISGMLFSFYHLGYPGFRTIGDILLLFAVDNMLCLLIFLQKRGFSLKLGKTNLTKALPKCKKETQHGNYNLCRNGCPQRQLFIMLL